MRIRLIFIIISIPFFCLSQKKNANSVAPNADDVVFTIVDNPPKFKGGEKKFDKFLKKNSKFSITSKQGNLNVFIQFVVNKKGEIENTSFIKPTDEELPSNIKKDVLRLFDLMPPWIPGTQNGETVNVMQVKRITYIFG